MNLLDLYREDRDLTWQDLEAYIGQLPPESATALAMRNAAKDDPTFEKYVPEVEHDPESEQWSRQEHLLAMIRDELVTYRWVWSQSKQKQKLKWKPDPLPRPGVRSNKAKKKPTNLGLDVLAAHLAATQGGEATYN